jgi:hypothetical protein
MEHTPIRGIVGNFWIDKIRHFWIDFHDFMRTLCRYGKYTLKIYISIKTYKFK